jgi:hypothetical protein
MRPRRIDLRIDLRRTEIEKDALEEEAILIQFVEPEEGPKFILNLTSSKKAITNVQVQPSKLQT